MDKNLNGKTVLCLGDSITSGALSSSKEKSYVSKLAEFSGATVIGYGAGGTRVARQQVPSENPVLDRYFALRVSEMQDEADYVIVFGGTNDFGHGDAPLGKLGDDTDDTFYGALSRLYKMLTDRYSSSKLVAITPLHRENEFKFREAGKIVYPLSDYVKAIKEVAKSYSIPVLDLYNCADMIPDIPEHKRQFFASDGLHPNDFGHERIAKLIYEFLLKIN